MEKLTLFEQQRIALAIQKPATEPGKSNMGDEIEEILKAGGLTFRKTSRVDYANTNIPGFYVWRRKNGDIAEAVGRKETLLGILGEDKLGEYYDPDSLIIVDKLGFSQCVLRFGVTERPDFGKNKEEDKGREYQQPKDLIGQTIVTNYPRGTGRWLDTQGVPWILVNGIEPPSGVARIVKVEGGAESIVNWGSAQACAEISETGTSMAANEIRPIADIMESQAVLIANPILRSLEWTQPIVLEACRKLLKGIWATRFTMLEVNYPKTLEDIVLAGLPARESPTKSNLADPNWGAAKVLIRKDEVDKWVDTLYQRGARDAVTQKVETVFPNLDDPDITRMMRVIYGNNWQPPTPLYPKESTRSLAVA